MNQNFPKDDFIKFDNLWDGTLRKIYEKARENNFFENINKLKQDLKNNLLEFDEKWVRYENVRL